MPDRGYVTPAHRSRIRIGLGPASQQAGNGLWGRNALGLRRRIAISPFAGMESLVDDLDVRGDTLLRTGRFGGAVRLRADREIRGYLGMRKLSAVALTGRRRGMAGRPVHPSRVGILGEGRRWRGAQAFRRRAGAPHVTAGGGVVSPPELHLPAGHAPRDPGALSYGAPHCGSDGTQLRWLASEGTAPCSTRTGHVAKTN
ncbi:hypothetical protein MMC22_005651 [Lobaria immixta]|nr:hypothetical protein [Lobaria immixta]